MSCVLTLKGLLEDELKMGSDCETIYEHIVDYFRRIGKNAIVLHEGGCGINVKIKPTKTRVPKIKSEHESFKSWRNKLDDEFREAMHRIYMKDGWGTCYTCGKITSKLDVGHFIGRGWYSNRWDFENCRMQCRDCNRFQEGLKGVFKKKLEQEYGEMRIALKEKGKNKKQQPPWVLKGMLKGIQAVAS